MKQLIYFINSLVLIALLLFFLLIHVSPFENGVLPEDVFWLDDWRHQISMKTITVGQWVVDNQLIQLKALALGVLFLNVLSWVFSSLFSRRVMDRITLEVNDDKVSITVRALEDSLARLLRHDDHVKDAKVVVSSGHSSVHIKAFLTLIESSNLHALESQFLERMRQHFKKIFPIQKAVNYEVVISKLRSSPSSVVTLPSEPKKTDSPAAVVDQPRYPDHPSQS